VSSPTPRVHLVGIVLLSAVGCSRPAALSEAHPARPPLPADVQGVASVASAGAAPDASSLPSGSGPGARAAQASAEDPKRLTLTGEFVSLVRSELVPRIGGRVAHVDVDEGQPVHRGQPLLQLETDYLKIDLARAEADLRRAEAAALDARRDLDRKTGLAQKGSVSQATFDRSQAGAEQADAGRQAARAALDLARQRLSDAVLTSPVDGVVAERRADVGERITEGTVAFVVEQTAPLKLRFRVPERYLGEARTGLPVQASVEAYPEQSFDGRVSLVGGSVDPQTRTFLVEAQFPNRDHRLQPGLFARVVVGLHTEATRAEAR
jgi:membrane fusion protein (multidrug efflux system)